MMQHIGRGNVRKIDADKKVGQMAAYVLAKKPDLLHDWQHTIGGPEQLDYNTLTKILKLD